MRHPNLPAYLAGDGVPSVHEQFTLARDLVQRNDRHYPLTPFGKDSEIHGITLICATMGQHETFWKGRHPPMMRSYFDWDEERDCHTERHASYFPAVGFRCDFSKEELALNGIHCPSEWRDRLVFSI